VSCFFDSLCINKSAEYFLLVVGPMYLASRWASPWLWEVSVDLSGCPVQYPSMHPLLSCSRGQLILSAQSYTETTPVI